MAINSVTNRSCGALIFCSRTKRFLFLLRSNGKQANKWGIVGGKLENNEDALSGLVREIREELDGEIPGAEFISIEEYIHQKNHFSYHTFLIKVDEEFVPELNQEHKGYCWVKIEDYPRPLHPGVWRTFSNSKNKEKINKEIN